MAGLAPILYQLDEGGNRFVRTKGDFADAGRFRAASIDCAHPAVMSG
jgi:hypothetical protein